MRAVELFIENDKSPAAVFRILGYPFRGTLYKWYREFCESGDLHNSRIKYSKFSEAQKLTAVRHYLENGQDVSKTVEALGYPSKTLLYSWVDEIAPGTRRKYGKKRVECKKEQKIASVIKLINKKAETIAEEAGVHQVTLHKWKKKLLGREAQRVMDDINDGQLPDDIESLKEITRDLQEEIRRHKMEVAVWQGAAELVKKDPGIDPRNLTNKEKAILIDALRTRFELKGLLELLEIARSSYYYQREAMASPDKYASLRIRIGELFDENNATWGYRRIWGSLRTDGEDPVEVSEKVVRRLMSEGGLKVICNRKKKHWSSYLGEIGQAPENIANRYFHAERPNELWLTDISQFTLPSFKCYLSPAIDCFDGKVVSWNISKAPMPSWQTAC